MRAIVVLGMHRSGTSCLAGMLAAAGLASAGEVVRNWDNTRGHHEMLDVVRLNEAVLAHSGGHWLSPPTELVWTAAHAAARDRLLGTLIDGRPPLLKDPRTLLALEFWRASALPFRALGIVRHPLAVARSLESWRGMPLSDGIALWLAHNRALAQEHAQHGTPLLDFERPRAEVIARVTDLCATFAPEVADIADIAEIDRVALAAAYEEQLVHHDSAEPPALPGLDQATLLYRELSGAGAATPRPRFPRVELAAFERSLGDGELPGALAAARTALASIADATAVLVPVVQALSRRGAHAEASALVNEQAARLQHGLAELLWGKLALAAGDAATAVRHLEAACAVPRPFFQARHLLPHALRAAARHTDARELLGRLASEALYAHGPLATLAEWSWQDGQPAEALAEMARAIAAAPERRRGRLRTRRAEWLLASGEPDAARAELERALVEDPAYARSRTLLATLPGTRGPAGT